MEGVYYESSATTPYHFLIQTELSSQPSFAHRGLPYLGFDIDRGVEHLRLLGVRYYLTFTEHADTRAAAHPGLTRIAIEWA